MIALLLLLACDRTHAPCVDTDSGSVVIWSDCDNKDGVELAGLTVSQNGSTMWGIASPSRDGTKVAQVQYGDAPEGWNTTGDALSLTSGGVYGVDLSYYDAVEASTDFTAP